MAMTAADRRRRTLSEDRMTVTSPRRRPAVRGALVAVLLAGTALGGYAAADRLHAQEQPPTNQQGAITPTPLAQQLPDFTRLVAQVQPAVVSITVDLQPQATADEDGDQQQMPQIPGMPFPFGTPGHGQGQGRGHAEARGSGFIVEANGTIVTNNHVVEHARSVTVTLNDGTVLKAKVIGRDPDTDIAVLRVDAGHPLPYLQLGNSDDVKVGEWVLAVGNPYGLSGTVTAGIVSARGRDIGDSGLDRNYIQVDAPINRGNSGGPLLTQNGRVIGINTAILSPTGGSIGIGFAIPSNLVHTIVAQLENGGHVVRGYLGVTAQSVTPAIAQAMQLSGHSEAPAQLGALVADVSQDGPAAKAGVQPGDIIQSVNGDAVHSPGDLVTRVTALKPGEDAHLGVLRNGQTQTVDVTLGTRPSQQTASAEGSGDSTEGSTPHIGLTLAPLSPQERDQLNLPSGTRGALIAGVESGSAAEAAGLQQGDVVLGVGEKPVGNPRDAIAAIGHAREGNHSVALRILRNGHAQFVVVNPDGKNDGNGEG
jgi:serine protease Do